MTSLLKYQPIRFLIVGIFNASVDYAVLNFLHAFLGISLFWSVFFGFLSGGITGYFLHSRFTFQYNTSGKEIVKFSHFIFISIVGLSLTEITIYFLTEIYSVNYNIAKFFALVTAVVWSYGANNWWVFHKRRLAEETFD